MLKKKACILLLLFSLAAFAQKEASNWYFGRYAGVHFNDDGTVIALAGGKMQTNEGCSAISDANGNLLFYTDGRTVWDRNHVIMPNADYFNGTGLLGDPSSTQSAIIVPKKNDPNIYYIFTVDEPHHLNAQAYPAPYTGTYLEGSPGSEQFQTIPMADDGYNNGLNYSVVDLSVTGTNGSIGDVTTRNIHLYTYDPADIEQAKYKCSEKVTAVKNNNGTGFWVITQFIDKFYAFQVNAAGVNSTPVVTQIAPVVPVSGYRRNAIGCIKASHDGNYVAIAHQQIGTGTGLTDTNGVVYLYNFNKATGVVSNPVAVVENVSSYGIEFSPKEKKLYVSFQDNTSGEGRVAQYDLLNANIPASGVTVATRTSSTTLQLGPNGKIYKAINGGSVLDAIEAPEEDGAACGYTQGAVRLPAGTTGIFGLPPFITSLFSASIIAEMSCVGQPTAFSLHVNNDFDNVSWNFGDNSPASADLAPLHTYSVPGTYTVVATITHEGETEDVTRDIIVTAPPVAHVPPNLTICDTDDNDADGFASFRLNDAKASILGAQGPAGYTIYFYATQQDADANLSPLNAAAYTNTANPQTIYARVINNNNPDCYATTSFSINVLNGPGSIAKSFSLCDDAGDGDDTNGKAAFNLTAIAGQMIQQSGFNITWYNSSANAAAVTNALPQTFYSGSTTIYARIQNSSAATCFSIVEVTLTVNPLPPNVSNAMLVQCDADDSPDGISTFNLLQADTLFTMGQANLAVRYFASMAEAQANTAALASAYKNNVAYNDSLVARVQDNVTGCYRLLPLALQVTVNTLPPVRLGMCDDSIEDGFTEFDLSSAGYENGLDSVVYYATKSDALLELNAVDKHYTNTTPGYQEVFARIESKNSCVGIAEIQLSVWPLPQLVVQDSAVVCLNTRALVTLSAGINGSRYSYLWSTGAKTRTIMVNDPGIYTVTVTDNSHPQLCAKERTITVTASNVAEITDVLVTDLADNNTVTIVAVPAGGVNTMYLYSLDNALGPWQEEPFFENVDEGLHTVYVYDTNGCGVINSRIGVLAIPNYFTPNSDGNNDYWMIPGLSAKNYAGSSIYVYDRYGKLLTALNPQDRGWNGTFNGHAMPATDYWYVLTLTDGRTVKGHFSLLR